MSATELAAVGLKAIEFAQAADARKSAAFEFGEACAKWKEARGHVRIERGTIEWGQMIEGVQVELASLKRAKAAERNARDRLFRACARAMR